MMPLFVVEHGMLDSRQHEMVTAAGYVVIELYHMPLMRALPIVITEQGVDWPLTLRDRLRLAWALLTQ